MSGAPLSHYLHVVREEVSAYRPDDVVVVVVHNDFRQSYVHDAAATSPFLELVVDGDVVRREVPPTPYAASWRSRVRAASATWRYLTYRRQVNIASLWTRRSGTARHAANIDVSQLKAERAATHAAASYVVRELARAAESMGARLLLVVDGNRRAIESGEAPDLSGPLSLNALLRDVATTHGVELVDLQETFAAAFEGDGLAFAFPHDGHWNAHAHDLAARAVAGLLAEDVRDSSPITTAAR